MFVDQVSSLYIKLFSVVVLVTSIFFFPRASISDYCGGFLYMAAAFGVVLARDWLSFLIFWELLTIGAFVLIFNGGQERSFAAAFRYAVTHLFGGLFMLFGVLLLILEAGDSSISVLDLSKFSSQLVFFGMGVNAGFPLLHFWVVDSYPEASPGGSILLAAITTKVAVYGFYRAFPGVELLVLIGTVMAVFPIVFAFVERDYRRVLAYCLLNPIGLMLVGIGLGTSAATQGALAFVVSHVIYKSLFFLSAGSLMYAGVSMRMDQPVNVKLSRIHRVLFFVAIFSMVMPGASGYIGKVVLLDEVKHLGFNNLYYLLVVSSFVVLVIAGFKPLTVFFKNEFDEQETLPITTVTAALILLVSSLGLGICPETIFFGLLPGTVDSHPNELGHIIQQCVYVGIAAIAYLALRKINLNFDTRLYDVNVLWERCCNFAYRIFDLLNAANKIAYQVFVKLLPSSLYEGIPKASDSLLQAVFIPYWSLSGDSEITVRRKVSLLRAENKDGFFPIGYTVIAATLLFLLLFAFYRLR